MGRFQASVGSRLQRGPASCLHAPQWVHPRLTRAKSSKGSLLAVDTHGYTNAALAVSKLLGFDLCVRLRNLAERMLYVPSAIARCPRRSNG